MGAAFPTVFRWRWRSEGDDDGSAVVVALVGGSTGEASGTGEALEGYVCRTTPAIADELVERHNATMDREPDGEPQPASDDCGEGLLPLHGEIDPAPFVDTERRRVGRVVRAITLETLFNFDGSGESQARKAFLTLANELDPEGVATEARAEELLGEQGLVSSRSTRPERAQ